MADTNQANWPNTDVTFLLDTAELLAQEGRHREARATFVAAIDIDETPRAQNMFGCYLLTTESYNEAATHFQAILNAAQVNEDACLRALAYNNLAAAHRGSGDFEKACSYQQQSLSSEGHCSARLDTASESCDWSNRANDAIHSGQFELAEELLWRALGIDQHESRAADEAADWGNLGALAILQDDWEQAVKCLWNAYEIHLELNDHYGLGQDMLNLAEALRKQGEHALAIDCLRHSIERFKLANARDSLKVARCRLDEAQIAEEFADTDPCWN
ncbi:MAG: hypothetical protein CMJ78_22500 [Planctomycetaceae bacterium]|nr:hypothetical protein [Planctomycetaceae bacterium]